METVIDGCEGRRYELAGAAIVAKGPFWADIVGSVFHWEIIS